MKTLINNLRKLSSIPFFMGTLAVLSFGCSQDDSPQPQETLFVPPSAAQFNLLREIALGEHTETVSFAAEDGISFTSNDGTTLNIPSNCLQLNGTLVTGEVELTFIDLFENGDMAPTNKPTMGLMPNQDKALLISGGEFFIEVRKDGVLLDPGCMHQLMVLADNTGGPDPEMILWKGNIDDNGNLTWEEIENNGQGGMFLEEDMYTVFIDEFGWTNIDRFYSDPRDKTTMKVKVPEGFDMSNSAVYLSYDGEPNALAQLDTFDEETGLFSEHYGQIPIGLEVHIIFATAEGDDWRYGIMGVTIAENEIYEFTLQETQVNTHENMVLAINNLP